MTFAPNSIESARNYLIARTPLAENAVGIVGSKAHKATGTSYHLGKDDLKDWKRPYSVYESSRDRSGLSNAAAALDIGNWPGLKKFSRWLVSECARGAADTRDIREVIYSPDGRTVKRWDRLGKRSSGDSSHLYHTHISYFRDSEKRDKVGLFERYFEGGASPSLPTSGVASPTLREGDDGSEVRLLQSNLNDALSLGLAEDGDFGPNTKTGVIALQRATGITEDGIYGPVSADALTDLLEDDMDLTDVVRLRTEDEVAYSSRTTTVEGVLRSTNYYVLQSRNRVLAELAAARKRDEAILAAVEGIDEAAILAKIDEKAAEDAQRDAELAALVESGLSGRLDAADVLRQMGELLRQAESE